MQILNHLVGLLKQVEIGLVMEKRHSQNRTRSTTSNTKSKTNRISELYNQFEEHDEYSTTTIPSTGINTAAAAAAAQSVHSIDKYQSHSLPAHVTRHETLSSLKRYQYRSMSGQPANNQNKCNTLEQLDKMSIDLPWNYTIDETEVEEKEDDIDYDNNNQETQGLNELILSQQMCQITTTTAHNNEFFMKEMQAEIEKIPNFLTKYNDSFKQLLYQTQSLIKSTTTDRKHLREVAIIIYKIMIIQTYHLLWTAYLKSGQGELVIPSEILPSHLTTIPVWPKDITSLLKLNNTINSHEIYLNFVNQHLHELDRQLSICKHALNRKANNRHGYSLKVQKIIETYIEEHIQSFRLKIEHQIELIHYDYQIRALKLEYVRHNPTQYQVEIMKKICQSKYEQETTEQEYDFFKQQMDYHNSHNQSFEHPLIPQAALIGTIENTDMRQQFFNQYKEVALQARNNLFQLYLTTAKDQREELKKKFEENVKQLYTDHKFINENRNLSSFLIQIINQRCEKISERIKCLYKFKAQSALLSAT